MKITLENNDGGSDFKPGDFKKTFSVVSRPREIIIVDENGKEVASLTILTPPISRLTIVLMWFCD